MGQPRPLFLFIFVLFTEETAGTTSSITLASQITYQSIRVIYNATSYGKKRQNVLQFRPCKKSV